MNLSRRLSAAYDMVDRRASVVDVGCDHGLLGLKLMANNVIKHLICADISEKALSRCKINAKQFKLTPDFIVSDGLSKINMVNIDTIIITGLGGNNIVQILSKQDISDKKLIISAQNNNYQVRHYLHQSGFKLIKEVCIYENRQYYFIMKWVYGKSRMPKYIQYYSSLIWKPSIDYINYLKQKRGKLQKIYRQMPINKFNKKMIIGLKIFFLTIIIFYIKNFGLLSVCS